MWLYYCKLRGANERDFESVNQLIVADKMFEMLDSETATHIGVLQGEEWYKPRDLGKQCDIFYASKGKSYDEPERAKWNDSEKRSFNGSWGKQPFGEKKSDNFSSRKNFDKGQVTEIKKFACFTCGSDKHFKWDCPKNKEVDNKRLNENKVVIRCGKMYNVAVFPTERRILKNSTFIRYKHVNFKINLPTRVMFQNGLRPNAPVPRDSLLYKKTHSYRRGAQCASW
ncbi:CCHC-type domain-containing protein [Trichonephila clavipes]|nr:CCHC-type domain-containing protein [Trichonephila clavipes]